MNKLYVFFGLFVLVCVLIFRFVAFDAQDYMIVDVPGLRDGEVWQFKCKRHSDESQPEFDARIEDAGAFFRASIDAALKDMRHEIMDTVRTKDGMAAVAQLDAADRALTKASIRTEKNLKILYDCKLIDVRGL